MIRACSFNARRRLRVPGKGTISLAAGRAVPVAPNRPGARRAHTCITVAQPQRLTVAISERRLIIAMSEWRLTMAFHGVAIDHRRSWRGD
jgi:hypothetical protein